MTKEVGSRPKFIKYKAIHFLTKENHEP